MPSKPVTGASAAASRKGLAWVTAALAGGMLLGVDRVPPWVPLVALVLVAWRLLAAVRPVRLPGTLVRSLVAFLLVAGVLVRFRTLNGLSAGTALLTLMGAVKLLETRAQRDQLIVIGAALFLLLAACLDRQLLLRAPLYLLQAWLCCAALAVVAYGPQDSAATRAAGPGGLSARAALGLAGRSLALAVPLALILFVFFPRLSGAFWAIPRSDEALTGLGDSMSPGSISLLTSSYEVAFRAHFDGAPPPPQERYWRGPVLHEFDGFTWHRTRGSLLRMEPLEYLGTAYRYRIALEPSAQRWWFSLDTVTGSPSPKVYFSHDYQLIASRAVTEPVSYTLTSHTSTRATREISESERRYDTQLPLDRNPRARELALQLWSRTGSDSAYVRAVLEYLRTGGFEYSLTPPRLGADSVDDFLFDTHEGFCGHYASAFVSLMRAANVPARVVTGYLGGEWNPIGRYFIVRQSDAHAWAEVWLQGRGWTRVDPTAVVEPERLRRGIIDLLPDAVSAPARFVRSTPWLSDLLQRWDALNTWWNDRVVRFGYADQLRLLERLGFKAPGAELLGWAFGAGLIGWLSWIAWQVGRAPRTRRPDRLSRAHAMLCRKLARAGITRQAHEGPLALTQAIAKSRPDLTARVEPLLRSYAQLRYGPRGSAHAAAVEQFVRAVLRFDARPRAPASATPRRSRTGS